MVGEIPCRPRGLDICDGVFIENVLRLCSTILILTGYFDILGLGTPLYLSQWEVKNLSKVSVLRMPLGYSAGQLNCSDSSTICTALWVCQGWGVLTAIDWLHTVPNAGMLQYGAAGFYLTAVTPRRSSLHCGFVKGEVCFDNCQLFPPLAAKINRDSKFPINKKSIHTSRIRGSGPRLGATARTPHFVLTCPHP